MRVCCVAEAGGANPREHGGAGPSLPLMNSEVRGSGRQKTRVTTCQRLFSYCALIL